MDDRLPEAEVVTLARSDDAYHFRAGTEIELVMGTDGSVRPANAWERLVRRIKARLRRMTRWWRPRSVVTCVDTQLGTVTIGVERWSWRRWRWE